jgi:hypothetical protein
MFADTFAGAIDCAHFTEIASLQSTLWKAHAAGHLTDDQAQGFAEQLAARKDTHNKARNNVTSFAKPGVTALRAKAAKPQRSPDKQRSIERRRQLADAAPIPLEHRHKFTTCERAAVNVIAREIGRTGACVLPLARIAAQAGTCKERVRSAQKKMRDCGLAFTIERRRRGQKSLTNLTRALAKGWGAYLRRWIGFEKSNSTIDTDIRKALGVPVDNTSETNKQHLDTKKESERPKAASFSKEASG